MSYPLRGLEVVEIRQDWGDGSSYFVDIGERVCTPHHASLAQLLT